ncbi:RHS repeat-associated core domain-containing protein [Oscillospiraceae bacterium 44-34]
MDYLGTTDYFTSPVSGKVEAWTHYNEWGLITHNAVLKCGQRELDLVKRYATHDYDSVLELYYAKARFYDAHDRRFTAVDPILDPSGYDLREYAKNPAQLVQYLYVEDNPLLNIDPLGLFTLPWDSPAKFFHDLKMDSQGFEILYHWLYGNGLELSYKNEPLWSTYMTKNSLLTNQVSEIVKGYCHQLTCGESKTIDESMSMVIENGEQIIGYQYLHGTNQDVGGFTIKGTISKDNSGTATAKLTYTWNDIIDPNFIYATDSRKAQFAKSIPFANPTDYIIRISWDDTSVLSSDDEFTSGWLAGDKWVNPKQLFNGNGGRG